jgi:DNA-binding response OmpR family regulator
MRLLVVEDDTKMASLLQRGLTENGNAVDIAARSEDALWMAGAHEYDAVVLDVMGSRISTASRPATRFARRACGRRC